MHSNCEIKPLNLKRLENLEHLSIMSAEDGDFALICPINLLHLEVHNAAIDSLSCKLVNLEHLFLRSSRRSFKSFISDLTDGFRDFVGARVMEHEFLITNRSKAEKE